MKSDHIPIVEITDENVAVMWPALTSAISESSFIAMDCELSGLGNRKKLNASEIDVRYQNISEIAHSHSIISFGVSCFKLKLIEVESVPNSEEVTHFHNYLIQTFNILVLRSDKYEIESGAVKFLVSHGFDFNRQYSHGLPFYQGDDVAKSSNDGCPSIREIFSKILEHEKPIVLHNGLVDLVFLYQNFYAELPKKLETFICDLTSMFPNGIYDTKYLADYVLKLPASYLEFLFRRTQLSNKKRTMCGQSSIRESFLPYPKTVLGLSWSPYKQIFDDVDASDDQPLCESFKYHGWCSKGTKCDSSHNITRIIHSLLALTPKSSKRTKRVDTIPLAEVIRQKREETFHENTPPKKRKRHSMNSGPDKYETLDSTDDLKLKSPEPQKQVGHRAGFDAFMTGHIFAYHVASTDALKESPSTFGPDDIMCRNIVNKVYLVAKSIPLLIRSGQYAKMSWNHLEKIQKIRPCARMALMCRDAAA